MICFECGKLIDGDGYRIEDDDLYRFCSVECGDKFFRDRIRCPDCGRITKGAICSCELNSNWAMYYEP